MYSNMKVLIFSENGFQLKKLHRCTVGILSETMYTISGIQSIKKHISKISSLSCSNCLKEFSQVYQLFILHHITQAFYNYFFSIQHPNQFCSFSSILCIQFVKCSLALSVDSWFGLLFSIQPCECCRNYILNDSVQYVSQFMLPSSFNITLMIL